MESSPPRRAVYWPEDPVREAAWYAVYTKSRHEQVAREQLAAKGIEAFLPTVRTWSRRTDRRLRIELPMFPSYLFVNTTLHPERHLSVLRTIGVVKLVDFKGRPMPVDPQEVRSLQILIDSGVAVHPTENYRIGDRVRIVEGVFKGMVGQLVARRSSTRLIVAVEAINRAVQVEVDDHLVRRVENF